MKEIPNTSLLVSLKHSEGAYMEIFDISNQDSIRKIYAFGEAAGGNNYYIVNIIDKCSLLIYDSYLATSKIRPFYI